MSWTEPRTWAVGEIVTSNLLNEQLRDNLTVLKSTNSTQYTLDESVDYTTNSTSFVDVDATKLSLSLTTTGGDVLVGFMGLVKNSSNYWMWFDLDVDGNPYAGDDGITGIYSQASENKPVGFTVLLTDLSAGNHTIKLQWKAQNGTVTLFAGASTSNADVHPQLWALEV